MLPEHEEKNPRMDHLILHVWDLKYIWSYRGKQLVDDLLAKGYTKEEIFLAEKAADILASDAKKAKTESK